MTADLSWPELVALAIVTSPAIISAISSLKNGQALKKLNGGNAGPVKKPPKKNGAHPDWYSPPDFK